MQGWPAPALVSLLLLGLVVGSFLNVVILRLPVMLKRQWSRDCRELLAQQAATGTSPSLDDSGLETPPGGPAAPEAALNLATPGSHCPGCHTPIAAWQNIPLISYLLLRGRCAACGRSIGLRYPLVELLGAAVAVSAGLAASDWLELGALLLVGWSLLALSGIDVDEQLLPDDITLPLLWAGLLYHLFTGSLPLADAVLGAAAGYMLLWTIYSLFRLATGKEGMGFGDFKLLAALGAWLGWQNLPLVILLSAGSGAILGLGLILLRGRDRAQPLPFGPYLAIAGWIALLWGDRITRFYLDSAGL